MSFETVDNKLESIAKRGCDYDKKTGLERLVNNVGVYESALNGDSDHMKEKFCRVPELFWEILEKGIDDEKFVECSCFFDLEVFKKKFLNISCWEYEKSGDLYFDYKMKIILEYSAAKEFHKIPENY